MERCSQIVRTVKFCLSEATQNRSLEKGVV